jgi:hypothetical protein
VKQAPLHDVAEQIAAFEQEAGRLSATWSETERRFKQAKREFLRADAVYQATTLGNVQAAEGFSKAKAQWEEARDRWQFYQKLVVVAAALDANNLARFQAETGNHAVKSLDCSTGMSTQRYRRVLEAQGMNLAGMDIDHIVPHSLGGADHPANYQVLPSSVNRSLGNSWNRDKCISAKGSCAGAVAISRKCASFSGTGFLP